MTYRIKSAARRAREFFSSLLELLQSVITRISNNGATLKNYCLTLTTAICGLSITLHQPLVGLLSILPIAVFALLDAQFLRVERRFRALFDVVRKQDWKVMPDFDMSLSAAPDVGYVSTLASWSITMFYGPLLIGDVLVVLASLWVRSQEFLNV